MPRLVMNCLFMGISSSAMGPYVLKISRRCAACTFLVSFSMTILAERGGGEAEGERVMERERERYERLREREGERERLRVPFGWELERLREGEREVLRAAAAGGVRVGVGDLPRDSLRSRGGEDMAGGVEVVEVEVEVELLLLPHRLVVERTKLRDSGTKFSPSLARL